VGGGGFGGCSDGVVGEGVVVAVSTITGYWWLLVGLGWLLGWLWLVGLVLVLVLGRLLG